MTKLLSEDSCVHPGFLPFLKRLCSLPFFKIMFRIVPNFDPQNHGIGRDLSFNSFSGFVYVLNLVLRQAGLGNRGLSRESFHSSQSWLQLVAG